jgi:outer membrane PBP1 activator LpoA protein
LKIEYSSFLSLSKLMNLRRLTLISIAMWALASCSSAPQKNTQKTSSDINDAVLPSQVYGSDYYIEKAKNAYTRSGDISLRNQWLLKAAETFQLEQSCQKSLKLLRVIEPELRDNLQQTQSKLITAECYMQLPSPAQDEAQDLLAKMSHNIGFDKRINNLKSQIFQQREQWLKAANVMLQGDKQEPQRSMEIWSLIQNLSLSELERARLREPQLQAWLQLSLIIHSKGLNAQQLSPAVIEWQGRFATHPLSQNLPPELLQALDASSFIARKVAVLLPLSGRLASQGLAIKEGILTSYLNNLDDAILPEQIMDTGMPLDSGAGQTLRQQNVRQIRFFDSALKTSDELNELVADYDFVIGPLLKENIEGLLKVLPKDKPMLALNRIELTAVKANLEDEQNERENFYFALAPEEEARQLAQHIRQKGFKRPIIFSANSGATIRMVEAFNSHWELSNKDALYIAPDTATFTDNEDMRKQVSQLLDVAQSKARIKQIENLVNTELYGVERNRRDIDAIVLFANPEQTELLNPIIESSLSPFARQTLAVFASSRSYSLELSKNSLRDLRNLTFSDMPWMLPQHKWPELAKQTVQLWPQRQDTLMRLFAMGYDAYTLVPKLRQLELLPQVSIQGLTGELSIDESGQIRRRLPWAQIIQDRVSLLAMD